MGIGFWQVVILLVIVLLLFGSTRLPMLARSLGQSITEFKKGMKELEDHSSDKSDRSN
jgi:sec-independent protein translocase protein TatA